MHAGAIRQLLYGCVYVREDNPRALASGLSPVHAHNHTLTYTYYNTLVVIASPSNEGQENPAHTHILNGTFITCIQKVGV